MCMHVLHINLKVYYITWQSSRHARSVHNISYCGLEVERYSTIYTTTGMFAQKGLLCKSLALSRQPPCYILQIRDPTMILEIMMYSWVSMNKKYKTNNHFTVSWMTGLRIGLIISLLAGLMNFKSDWTQLSMSIPKNSSTFSSCSNSPREKYSLAPLSIPCEIDTVNMSLALRNDPSQKQTSWNPVTWENSMGGPLGEALNSTSNSVEANRSSLMLNLRNNEVWGWSLSIRIIPNRGLAKDNICLRLKQQCRKQSKSWQ